jgi:hypothetical protein
MCGHIERADVAIFRPPAPVELKLIEDEIGTDLIKSLGMSVTQSLGFMTEPQFVDSHDHWQFAGTEVKKWPSDDSDKDLYQPEGADSNDMEKSSGDDEGESGEESQTGTAGPGDCSCQTVHSSHNRFKICVCRC